MATLALQHPDLAADQLDEAVRKLGMRGAAIGGSVEGQELSDRKFDPFWAKAEELGVLSVHAPAARLYRHDAEPSPAGKRRVEQHDRQPSRNHGIPVAPHFRRNARSFSRAQDLRGACGRLPAFVQRPVGCVVRARRCNGADCKALKKKPSEYFRRQLLIDTMVFREEGLRHLWPKLASATSSMERTIPLTGPWVSTLSSMRLS